MVIRFDNLNALTYMAYRRTSSEVTVRVLGAPLHTSPSLSPLRRETWQVGNTRLPAVDRSSHDRKTAWSDHVCQGPPAGTRQIRSLSPCNLAER